MYFSIDLGTEYERALMSPLTVSDITLGMTTSLEGPHFIAAQVTIYIVQHKTASILLTPHLTQNSKYCPPVTA